jgi:hypothetical protein
MVDNIVGIYPGDGPRPRTRGGQLIDDELLKMAMESNYRIRQYVEKIEYPNGTITERRLLNEKDFEQGW